MAILCVLNNTVVKSMAPISYDKADQFRWRLIEHSAIIKGLAPLEKLLSYHVSEGR